MGIKRKILLTLLTVGVLGSVAAFGTYSASPAEGNQFSFFVRIGGAWEPRVSSGVVPTTNTTYHVVGTYDGSNLRIYVDGQLKATQARTGAIDNGTGSLGIGVSPYWSGAIDDVALYDVPLTGAQVQAHYDAH
jgi:hypothetical protein